MTSLRENLDRANPNTVSDGLRTIKLGQTLLQNCVQVTRRRNPDAAGTSPSTLATLDCIKLPDDCKCNKVLRAYDRGLGELTLKGRHVTPTAGTMDVSPSGDLVFVGTDAANDVDVTFVPERGDMVTYEGPVAADSLALPAFITAAGVVLLAEVTALTGGAGGTKIVLTPAAGAPAAGQARLNVACNAVAFAAADAVTSARVKLLVASAADLLALMEGTEPPLV